MERELRTREKESVRGWEKKKETEWEKKNRGRIRN